MPDLDGPLAAELHGKALEEQHQHDRHDAAITEAFRTTGLPETPELRARLHQRWNEILERATRRVIFPSFEIAPLECTNCGETDTNVRGHCGGVGYPHPHNFQQHHPPDLSDEDRLLACAIDTDYRWQDDWWLLGFEAAVEKGERLAASVDQQLRAMEPGSLGDPKKAR